MSACDLSVVIPIFNEQENLPALYKRLIRTLEKSEVAFEIIFVNDHSRDRSLPMMRALSRRDARVRVVSLSRNFGHQTAITAGLAHTRGDCVILMDGDLQDPPEVLPMLMQHRREGDWDVVYAIRRKRKEPPLVRLMYYLFYRMLSRMSTIEIPLDTGDFCIMTRRVADRLNELPERNRFVRGLRAWVGFRQTGMEYERAARYAGTPKYTFKSLMRLAFDGILSFSNVPLRVSMYLGLFVSIGGILYALFIIIGRLLGAYKQLPGWSTTVVAVLVLGGVQLLMLGVFGEYLGRIYEEIKGRPRFVVDELIGFENELPAPERSAAEDEPAGKPA